MSEMTTGRRVGQVVFLLGLLAWGFGISYAEAGVDSRANALFLGGTIVMVVGIAIIRRESATDADD